MIAIVGDAMVDRYIYGEVTRMSPDAPVPVVRVTGEEDRDGAAANVVANCRAMGSGCYAIYGKGTIIKERIIGSGRASRQHIVRIDYDNPLEAIEPDDEAFLGAVTDPGTKVVVFSDYAKGSLRKIGSLIYEAKRHDCIVLVDPKGHDWNKYAGVHLIKPNVDEMRDVVGGWSDEIVLQDKAMRLMRELEIEAIMLTRAQDGMTLFFQGAVGPVSCRNG